MYHEINKNDNTIEVSYLYIINETNVNLFDFLV
ncbi:hypothetical protein M2373_000901 [Chryseobacterium sp. JUb7]|nr:hypothetical protein [Chryseobacterium sp. JUb7]